MVFICAALLSRLFHGLTVVPFGCWVRAEKLRCDFGKSSAADPRVGSGVHFSKVISTIDAMVTLFKAKFSTRDFFVFDGEEGLW